jgi:hypothetical protein
MKTKEEKNKYKKEWLAKHPGYQKRFYQRRKHIILPRQRAYQKKNAAKARETKRKWIAEHPKEWRAYCNRKMQEYYRKTHPNCKKPISVQL